MSPISRQTPERTWSGSMKIVVVGGNGLIGSKLVGMLTRPPASPPPGDLISRNGYRCSSGHGSHHEYDTHVPVLFWGAPFAARETDEACAPYDLAPTLADVLGLRLPEATGTSHAPHH